MAIGNVELMHDHCPQPLCMGTAELKEDKDLDKESKK